MKIDKICRTCLSESSDLRSIFKLGVIAGKTTTLSKVLMEFTKLTIKESNIFPNKMCYSCVIQVHQSFAFLQTCFESDRYLREKLGTPKVSRKSSDCDDNDKIIESETQTVYSYNAVNIEQENGIDVHIEPSETKVLKDRSILSLSNNNYNIIMSCHDETDDEIELNSNMLYSELEDDGLQTEILEIQPADNVNLSSDNTNDIDYYDEQSTSDMTSKIQELKTHVNETINYSHFDQSVENENIMINAEPNDKIDFAANKNKHKTKKNFSKNNIQGPPYICKICKKHLSTRSSMKYHMQLHSSSTPFSCNECGEGFKTKNAYDGHKTTHDTNNPHKCELCGKVYRMANSLKNHMLTHTGEKPFLCGICGKGMTQKSGFKKHMLIHSGEMPFECSVCHKKFRYSSNLITHKKIRCKVKEKSDNSEIYNQTFSTPSDLKRHIKVHQTKIIAECNYCNKRFGKLEILAAHIKLNHKTEYKKFNVKEEIDYWMMSQNKQDKYVAV